MTRRRSGIRLPRLAGDEQGSVLVYVSIMAAMLVGMAGLTIDMGRFVTTNTQAKAAADASAIAAATAVAAAVRAPGANPDDPQPVIDAAWQAAQTGVSNRQSFANVVLGDTTTVGGAVKISRLRLLTSLPELEGGSSSDPVDAYVTTNPWQAHFVEVTTESLSQTNAFLPVVGTSQTSSTGATAIAGFHQVLCRVPPMWTCNPAESNGAGSIFVGDDWRGRQLRMRSNPGGSQVPGNFGLLDTPTGSQSVPDLIEMMASTAPKTCFNSNGVDFRPGEANPAYDGLNTRFDIYDKLKATDYPPAENVTKAFQPDTTGICKKGQVVAAPQYAMPRDSNLVSDPNALVGNGQWNCLSYWNDIHSGLPAPTGCTTASQMTRYELYRYEIDNALITANGTPTHTPVSSPDRRIMYFALVNCVDSGLHGNESGVPAVAFVKALLTEPPISIAQDSSNPSCFDLKNNYADVYVEIIDVVRPGTDDGALHEIVQLYR